MVAKSYSKDLCSIGFTLCIVVVLIFAYGAYRSRNKNYKDPLLTNIGISDIDGWSISHFLLFALLSYMYPNYWLELLIFGIAWEGFEYVTGKIKPDILKQFGNCNGGSWWFGRWSDVLMNSLGVGIGVMMKMC